MRPTRNHLHGFSPSQFKTMLKRMGHKVPRDFFSIGCITQRSGRLYRWRWWSEGFCVDVSCPKAEFDRWANSTDETFYFEEWRQNEPTDNRL